MVTKKTATKKTATKKTATKKTATEAASKPQGTSTNRASGGLARANALTREQRSLIAKRGAAARWGEKPLKATHKGNFLSEFGIDVDCYVLEDAGKTAVISQSGVARILGLVPRGSVIERFATSQAMADFVEAELLEKIKNPLVFQWGVGGAEQPPSSIHGHNASVLIDLCRAIAKANAAGKLNQQRYSKIVAQAAIITGASANAGIQGLVYALAGFDRKREEVIGAFKAFVMEEARKYEQEFPGELYVEWQRLYQIPVPVRGKPWQFMHLTRRHVYYPLAQSRGQILELLRALRDRDPNKKKLFQFLNEVGTRALRMHMGRILEMAESSETSAEYESKFAKRFGGQQELDLSEG
ncbi:P63C domain-containing protein [Burkholderia gladioli]|uniref:P63C domain-containing protein n=1 Tax=Burkholderia gladioli TaxID=28095 RepID=UPI001642BBD3|nr:P63C domain-containing protein [Burkholderia gladioli]